jgi:hypothetical protein
MRQYKVNILGTTYVYRGATRREIETVLRLENESEQEDAICRICVITPRNIDWDNSLAGVPSALAKHILEASGMSEESSERFWKGANEWILTAAGKSESLMMGIFHIPLSEVANLDPEDWYRMATASQLLAVTLYNIDIRKYMELQPGEQQAQPAKQATFPYANDPNSPVIPPPLSLPEKKPSGGPLGPVGSPSR